ncbi:MAG: hypothetical protein RLZZ08_297 [Pseudomonadota bacterium]
MRSMRLLATAALLAIAAPAAETAFAQAPGEDSAVLDTRCDRACLLAVLQGHMHALAARNPAALPLAKGAVFTENNVVLPVGAGLWATVTGVDATGLELADPRTGQAAWFGSVKENGVPAIYAVRIRVRGGMIDQIESVVHRKTGLPAPFGDVAKMQHDAAFAEVLPPKSRRPRERMLAIADSYFDTVELNDGQVFAPFADDCARLENGISTTAPPPASTAGATGGNAASIASGCRDQFLLGLYRINKRIRERQYPLVDEERGVVVASGFFDHANEWDHYLLTNGRQMKTALKWPNSISLLEAFRIKDAAIQRIEAVFTYVPYFMHNPYAGPPATAPAVRSDPRACTADCLAGLAGKVMAAYVSRDTAALPWAARVGYAENSVGIRVDEGIWRTVTAMDTSPLVVADSQTGKAVWIGRIEEHGQPAWAAITVAADGTRIGGIDALIRRKEYGAPYAEPALSTRAPADMAPLAPGQRTSRAAVQAAADRFFRAMDVNKAAPADIAAACHWMVNGQDAGSCAAAFGGEPLGRIGAIRNRTLLALDEAHGLAVYRLFEDLPATGGSGYPLTFQVNAVLHFDSGRITRVEAFTSELPLGMKPHL